MRIQKAAVGWLVMVCLLCVANTGQAQLLRKLFGTKNTGQVSSSCPGGNCPTSSAPAAYQSRGHYTYPGTIDNHLEYDHRVSTAGMTREQKLDMHDAIHRDEAGLVLQGETTVTMVPRANYVAPFVSNYRSYTTSSGGGSFGLGSVGSRSGGSTGDFAVGKFYKGELVTSIGPVNSVSVEELSESVARGIGRRDFRRELLSQAKQAQADGTISSEELQATERLLKVPGVAMMLEARAGRAGAVDWATLFEKLLPLILELIKLLSANDVPTAMDDPKSIYVSFPRVASAIESFEPLPLTI